MKRIIALIIFLVLTYTGYQYIRAYVNFSTLSSQMHVIISEPQSYSIESMKKYILAEAAKLKIPLSEEGVEIEIRKTDRASLGETLLKRPGIDVESRLLVIHFSYPVEILGLSKTFSYDIERVFTARASLADPYQRESGR